MLTGTSQLCLAVDNKEMGRDHLLGMVTWRTKISRQTGGSCEHARDTRSDSYQARSGGTGQAFFWGSLEHLPSLFFLRFRAPTLTVPPLPACLQVLQMAVGADTTGPWARESCTRRRDPRPHPVGWGAQSHSCWQLNNGQAPEDTPPLSPWLG